MNKPAAVLAAIALSTSATGCFTATGAMIGHQSKHREVHVTADGQRVEREDNHIVMGALIGLALDALIVYAVVSSSCLGCLPGYSDR